MHGSPFLLAAMNNPLDDVALEDSDQEEGNDRPTTSPGAIKSNQIKRFTLARIFGPKDSPLSKATHSPPLDYKLGSSLSYCVRQQPPTASESLCGTLRCLCRCMQAQAVIT
jgi:hypothetical protein